MPTARIRSRIPRRFSNLLEMVSIFAICSRTDLYLGRMTGSQRHGWAVWAAMAILFLAGVTVAYWAEARGNPLLKGVDQRASMTQSGGNMEGKEVRFGIANYAPCSPPSRPTPVAAPVNGLHDSFTPLGGMVPLVNIMLSEVIFGGVGAGMYGMLIYVVLAVFIAGLMVGRTPEYLGKKIEAYDVKMAMLVVLIFPLVILIFTGDLCGQTLWHVEHPESWSARPQRDAVRVHFRGGQQRFGIWRIDRQHSLVQHDHWLHYAGWPLPHDHSHAGDRRQPGAERNMFRHLSARSR